MIERVGDAILYLGDCYTILRGAPPADAIVTDPPYGIGWKRSTNNARASKAHDGIANDHDTSARDGALEILGDIPGFVFGSFYAPYPAGTKQVLVWHKPADSGVVGCVTGYRRDAEPIFIVGAWPARKVKHSSVLRGRASFRGHAAQETGHPHAKPIDLISRLVMDCPGETVIDPFMGSGTTGVACVNLGRKFIGIEIDPTHFQTARARITAAYAQQRLFA